MNKRLVLFILVSSISAFYLPGVAPRDYDNGEEVELKVNKLDSVKTQLPYDFYSLHFCRPKVIEEAAENLGEVLSGDRIETSAYELQMQITESCKILCKKDYSEKELKAFSEKIEEEYRVNWIIDNIPAATKYYIFDQGDDKTKRSDTEFQTHYEKGFALGFTGSNAIANTKAGIRYINNHVRLIVFYHTEPTSYEGSRIVGFEVEPFSVKHELNGEWTGVLTSKLKTCTPLLHVTRAMDPQPVSGKLEDAEKTIIWTYDVKWQASDIKWASRWDLYLKMVDSEIHWFSIVNSIIIVLFLTGMVAMIMMRTLHRDLRRYNELELSEDPQEETGWKLVHGEVFRPPRFPGFYCVMIGTGYQVTAMTFLTLIFACLGFLSPANRGGLMTALLLMFAFMGTFAGYFSTRYYKMFKLVDWKTNIFYTAMFFPGINFTMFFILNLFVWHTGSSGAVPFSTLLALMTLWLGISVPLCYLGAYFGFNKRAIEPPVKVNNIPRMLLPDVAWYNSPALSVLVGGILPFGAVFIEIFFIMSSVWLHQFYYVFGFLMIVFLILIITCAEISIVMCYFQLCAENYHWWWRSYLTSGSAALYLFAYSILYFMTKLNIVGVIPAILYFGYMALVSFAFFVLTGTIGTVGCYYFVHKIYSSVKID